MSRIARTLFGFRDDIDLNQRWWHRAFKVIGALTLIAFLTLAIFSFHHLLFQPKPLMVNVKATTLRDYLKASPKEVVNVTPGFLVLPGELGQIENNGISYLYFGDVERQVCTPDAYRHAAALAYLMNNTPGGHGLATADDVTKAMKAEKVEDSACWTPDEVKLPEASKIVKYTFTSKVITISWMNSVLSALAAGALLWILAANFYYRGLVYIICGPRLKPIDEA